MTTPSLRLPRALAWLVALSTPALFAQVTESPFTVRPGKVLVEMDGLKFSADREHGDRFTALGVASTMLSAGIYDTLDVQAGVDFFVRETLEVGGARDSQSGIGDLAFRAKWTFWRNEKRDTALAVIPYVKLPSGTGGIGSDALQGGIILPWSSQLTASTSAGAMLHWDVVRNDDENGYDAHCHLSSFVQQNLTRAMALYAEATVFTTSASSSQTSGSLGIGALVQVTTRVQLDYELQRGINRRATDWTHTLRVNWEW